MSDFRPRIKKQVKQAYLNLTKKEDNFSYWRFA